MKILRTKRAETLDLTLMNIFITIFAATVLITITISIYDLNKTTRYEKELLATRLSLVIDSILATEDNLEMSYFSQIFDNKFKYRIQENLVEVYDAQGKGGYSFIKKPMTRIMAQINDKEIGKINIIKNGNDLLFTEKEISPIKKISCPAAKKINSIILDLGKGNNPDYPEISSKGMQKNNLTESIILTQIGRILAGRIKNYYSMELTRSYETAAKNNEVYEDVLSPEKRKEKIKNSQNEFLLSINLGESRKGNIIKAYINAEQDKEKYEQSYAIACQIINELTQDLSQSQDIFGATIVPIAIKQQKNKDLDILEQEKPGLFIEIGNIELFENQNNILQTAKSIFEALQNAQQ